MVNLIEFFFHVQKTVVPLLERNSQGHLTAATLPSSRAPGGRLRPRPQPTVLPGGVAACRGWGSRRSSRPGLHEVTTGAADSRGCPTPCGHWLLLCGERRRHGDVPALGEAACLPAPLPCPPSRRHRSIPKGRSLPAAVGCASVHPPPDYNSQIVASSQITPPAACAPCHLKGDYRHFRRVVQDGNASRDWPASAPLFNVLASRKR